MNKLLLPRLETERLFLKKISLLDIDDIFDYAVSPLVGPSAGWKPHESKNDTEEFIKYAIKKRDYGQPGIYAIHHKKHNKMIGTIEIHGYKEYKGDIGFVLNPKYWNKGLMTEAAKAIRTASMAKSDDARFQALKRLEGLEHRQNSYTWNE